MDGKSVKPEIQTWYDEKSAHIKPEGKGLTASTVSNDPNSKRYHPNLCRKLTKLLRDAGALAHVMKKPMLKRPKGEHRPRLA